MKRCVIIGASGLIGSHLIDAMTPEWEIYAVSRSRPTGAQARNVIWHGIDMQAFDAEALPNRVDSVIYLAQSEHFREFPERALDIFEVNTLGLLRLLDYARRGRARSFILASSGGVYGSGDESMNEEASIPAEGNLGFYLGSKLCSEIIALNYSRFMNVVVLRFFFVYGPRQRRSMLIPRLIDAVREGSPIQLQGQNGIRLNPTHVADAAGAIVGALELEGTYKINVAGPQILSLREICETIGNAVGRPPNYIFEAAAPRNIIGDITRMCELLLAPRVRFVDGLKTIL
jgi:nucleoside-diphosphate-sugar epimerase